MPPPRVGPERAPDPRARKALPTADDVLRVVLLRDYNTRVVFLGTLLLGISAGVVGVFMLLRKRSLVGDVVSHASLPGIAVAFLVLEVLEPGRGKSLGGLLTGALIAGLLGVLCTTAIRRQTRIKEDAALAIVLSIFFGLGVALFTVIQNIPTGNAAGLSHFIFGKAASMVADDVLLIARASAVVLLVCGLLFKEFSLLCFDEEFASAQGWPVVLLDLVLMGLVVGVTVVGLQSVGLLLVVAMLIIPAAAARFWTDELPSMTVIAAALGGLGSLLGVTASALFPRLAAGAVIVLAGSFLFAVSLLFGTRRGLLGRVLAQQRLKRRVGRHDLMRAFYECLEPDGVKQAQTKQRELARRTVPFAQLAAARTWSPARLKKLLAAARREHLVIEEPAGGYRLTALGAEQARRAARNHRLWELYLIKYADIAPSHVDRDADQIEHILDPGLIAELDALLSQREPETPVPPSPHPIGDADGN